MEVLTAPTKCCFPIKEVFCATRIGAQLRTFDLLLAGQVDLVDWIITQGQRSAANLVMGASNDTLSAMLQMDHFDLSLYKQEALPAVYCPKLGWLAAVVWGSLSKRLLATRRLLTSPKSTWPMPAQLSGGRYPIWFNSIFEFCQKLIQSIFHSILLYPRFNSK